MNPRKKNSATAKRETNKKQLFCQLGRSKWRNKIIVGFKTGQPMTSLSIYLMTIKQFLGKKYKPIKINYRDSFKISCLGYPRDLQFFKKNF